MNLNKIAEEVVRALLGEQLRLPIFEASVHRPSRGRVWVAAFTGPAGGQIWRSTGLTNRDQALLVAKQWEREARAERARLGHRPNRPNIRVRQDAPSTGHGPLTQREVALLLRISERSVKAIERRAIQKLRSHPQLRQVWQQFLSGQLDENQQALTNQEIEAVFNLVRTPEEWLLVKKILTLIRF